jgi:hypothetical protein
MNDTPDDSPLEPGPNDEAVSQVIYHYGMAMYLIQVLEHQVVNLIVASKALGKGKITREEIRRLSEDVFRKTMGVQLRDLVASVDVPEEVRDRLEEVITERNHLAHRFFREHYNEMQSIAENKRLVQELIALQKYVLAVEEELTELERSIWRARGMKYPF